MLITGALLAQTALHNPAQSSNLPYTKKYALSAQSAAEIHDFKKVLSESLLIPKSNNPDITDEEIKTWLASKKKRNSLSAERRILIDGSVFEILANYILFFSFVIPIYIFIFTFAAKEDGAVIPPLVKWLPWIIIAGGVVFKFIQMAYYSIKGARLRAESGSLCKPDSINDKIKTFIRQQEKQLRRGKNSLGIDEQYFELTPETVKDLEILEESRVIDIVAEEAFTQLGIDRLEYLATHIPVEQQDIQKRHDAVEELLAKEALMKTVKKSFNISCNDETYYWSDTGRKLAEATYGYYYSKEIRNFLNSSWFLCRRFLKKNIYNDIAGTHVDPGSENKYLGFENLIKTIHALSRCASSVESTLLHQVFLRICNVRNTERIIHLFDELKTLKTSRSKQSLIRRLEIGEEIYDYFHTERIRLFAALKAIGEIDALYATASYSKGYKIPEQLDDDSPAIILKGAHNPYVKKKRERSDPIEQFIIDKDKRLVPVTGPQGSGKSTLSQTVGWLIILAQIGARVPVDVMQWTPIALCVSVDPQGSQKLGLSHSIAQFKRVKEHLDMLTGMNNKVKRLFLILDEVFAGVNSYEKPFIELAFIKYMLGQKVAVLYTTQQQDVSDFIELNKKTLFNGANNKHFEGEDQSGNFSHKLLGGPAKREDMNAIRILERMLFPAGIISVAQSLKQLGSLDRQITLAALTSH